MTLVQKLTSESINNYFVLRDIMITSGASEKEETKMMWHKNNNHINSYLDSLSRISIIQILNKQTLNYLIDARKEYIERCLKFFEILDTKDLKKSSYYFKNEVEKNFLVYQNYISNFISIHKAEVTAYSISLSKGIKFFNLDSAFLGIPIFYYITIFYFLCTFLYLFFLIKIILSGLHKKAT